MAMVTKWKLDIDNAAGMLQAGAKRLDRGLGEVTVDFSCVSRIDARMAGALEELADRAQEKGVQVTLCGVHVDVYKALKLARLASRFSFSV